MTVGINVGEVGGLLALQKSDAPFHFLGGKLEIHYIPALVQGHHDGGSGKTGRNPGWFLGGLVKIVVAPASVNILIALQALHLGLSEVFEGGPLGLIALPVAIELRQGLDSVGMAPDIIHGIDRAPPEARQFLEKPGFGFFDRGHRFRPTVTRAKKPFQGKPG